LYLTSTRQDIWPSVERIFRRRKGQGGLAFDGQFVFSQVLDFLPRRDFNACVERYRGNYKSCGFSCRDQFLVMAFAQLTYRESLRDIEICLRALGTKLYHAGFRSRISRSTMADANQRRDWRIYADFAHILIRRARVLYAKDELAVDLEDTAYALDSTTIDLCLTRLLQFEK